ncbi:hypothetical protein PRELSG_1349500 [Plasmodium relictum]|uniref:Surface-associated interspersed protein (SURFIN) n=1 Tax=Plasmodium relictum TaxID=85471 RepID=A0A1J1HE93_PLARL|nr:hypothetical protein PRELSG_1349500 [Plasmodium relictum]CRH04119.1 hypothetical protein PRELSG_1349500 [Plasmodium relictum]
MLYFLIFLLFYSLSKTNYIKTAERRKEPEIFKDLRSISDSIVKYILEKFDKLDEPDEKCKLQYIINNILFSNFGCYPADLSHYLFNITTFELEKRYLKSKTIQTYKDKWKNDCIIKKEQMQKIEDNEWYTLMNEMKYKFENFKLQNTNTVKNPDYIWMKWNEIMKNYYMIDQINFIKYFINVIKGNTSHIDYLSYCNERNSLWKDNRLRYLKAFEEFLEDCRKSWLKSNSEDRIDKTRIQLLGKTGRSFSGETKKNIIKQDKEQSRYFMSKQMKEHELEQIKTPKLLHMTENLKEPNPKCMLGKMKENKIVHVEQLEKEMIKEAERQNPEYMAWKTKKLTLIDMSEELKGEIKKMEEKKPEHIEGQVQKEHPESMTEKIKLQTLVQMISELKEQISQMGVGTVKVQRNESEHIAGIIRREIHEEIKKEIQEEIRENAPEKISKEVQEHSNEKITRSIPKQNDEYIERKQSRETPIKTNENLSECINEKIPERTEKYTRSYRQRKIYKYEPDERQSSKQTKRCGENKSQIYMSSNRRQRNVQYIEQITGKIAYEFAEKVPKYMIRQVADEIIKQARENEQDDIIKITVEKIARQIYNRIKEKIIIHSLRETQRIVSETTSINEAGTVPRDLPGTIIDATSEKISGCVSGIIPGAMSGVMPGAMPGVIPGIISGAIPGTITGVIPGTIPGTITEEIPGIIPIMIPGYMPNEIPCAMTGTTLGVTPEIVSGEVPGIMKESINTSIITGESALTISGISKLTETSIRESTPVASEGSKLTEISMGESTPVISEGSKPTEISMGESTPVISEGSKPTEISMGESTPIVSEGSKPTEISMGESTPVVSEGSKPKFAKLRKSRNK